MSERRTTVLVVAIAVSAALAGIACDVDAQSLPDPTRPPTVSAPPAARSEGPRAAAPAPIAAPQLQALQLPSEGAASALVDGHIVHRGERVGEHTVVAIDANGITLRNARGQTQVLSLLNGVTKTASGQPTDNRTENRTALAARSAPKENR